MKYNTKIKRQQNTGWAERPEQSCELHASLGLRVGTTAKTPHNRKNHYIFPQIRNPPHGLHRTHTRATSNEIYCLGIGKEIHYIDQKVGTLQSPTVRKLEFVQLRISFMRSAVCK